MCLPACRARLRELLGYPGHPGNLAVVPPSTGGAPWHTARWQHVIDLTHTLDPDFPSYDGGPPFHANSLSTHAEAGWYYREWHVHEHSGTHLDAPVHRVRGGASADQLAPGAFVGPLAVVDLKDRAARDADTELTLDDLAVWEKRHGRLPDGAIVAMNSGWDRHARSPRFRGADGGGGLHFPGIHPEATRFLLEQRNVSGLAVDTLSLDHGPSVEFPTHTLWLGSGRWGLECVANLDAAPALGATVFVGIPKIAGASGGPARVLALV